VLTKSANGMKAKFIGAPWIGSKEENHMGAKGLSY
jgi:hypothetical protein